MREITVCGYCRKRIHQQRNGAWYHNRNASTSCRPGEGSERRAFPLTITVPDDGRAVTHPESAQPR